MSYGETNTNSFVSFTSNCKKRLVPPSRSLSLQLKAKSAEEKEFELQADFTIDPKVENNGQVITIIKGIAATMTMEKIQKRTEFKRQIIEKVQDQLGLSVYSVYIKRLQVTQGSQHTAHARKKRYEGPVNQVNQVKINAIEVGQAAEMRESELRKPVEEHRLSPETEREVATIMARADANLYKQQKEAEGTLAIFHAQAQGMKSLVDAWGDRDVALQFIQIVYGDYQQPYENLLLGFGEICNGYINIHKDLILRGENSECTEMSSKIVEDETVTSKIEADEVQQELSRRNTNGNWEGSLEFLTKIEENVVASSSHSKQTPPPHMPIVVEQDKKDVTVTYSTLEVAEVPESPEKSKKGKGKMQEEIEINENAKRSYNQEDMFGDQSRPAKKKVMEDGKSKTFV